VQDELRESTTGKHEISGFGDSVVKISDSDGKTICYIGRTSANNKEMVHFPSPVPVDLVAGVQVLLEKRKMRKALDAGDYEKAQRYADKKWSDVYSG